MAARTRRALLRGRTFAILEDVSQLAYVGKDATRCALWAWDWLYTGVTAYPQLMPNSPGQCVYHPAGPRAARAESRCRSRCKADFERSPHGGRIGPPALWQSCSAYNELNYGMKEQITPPAPPL